MKFTVIVHNDVKGQVPGNAAQPNGRHFVFRSVVDVRDNKEATLKTELKKLFSHCFSPVPSYRLVTSEYFPSSWGVTTLYAKVQVGIVEFHCFLHNL